MAEQDCRTATLPRSCHFWEVKAANDDSPVFLWEVRPSLEKADLASARRADSLCIFPGAGPGLSRSLSPWPGCEPSHSQPDGSIRNRPNASKLASARCASASCCVRSHYHAIPSVPRPISRSCAATENPLPCHIGPNGAQAFSLVGSLIPICPAFTPPIGGFGLSDWRVQGTPELGLDSHHQPLCQGVPPAQVGHRLVPWSGQSRTA